MKTSRKSLEIKIKKYLLGDYLTSGIETKNKIKAFLNEKGYSDWEIDKMLTLRIDVSLLNEMDFGVLALALSKVGVLDFQKYFNEKKETDAIVNYVKESKNSKDNIEMELNYFKVISDGKQYIGAVPIQLIKTWFDDNHLIEYDVNYQRETLKKRNKRTGEVIEVLNINQNKVNDIAESIEHKLYFPNSITIAVRKNGLQNVVIKDLLDGQIFKITVTADEDTKVFCPDGMHRILGYTKEVNISPDVKQEVEVRLIIVDEEETGEYISQIDKHTPLLESHSKMYNMKDVYLQAVKDMNLRGNEVKYYIFNKGVEDVNDLKAYKDKWYTLDAIARAVQVLFFDDVDKPDKRQLVKVINFIHEGLDEIAGIMKEARMTDSIYYANNTWIGYIGILKILYGKENWKEQLEKIIKNLKIEETTDLTNLRFNKTTIKRINDYFLSKIDRSEEEDG